MRGEGRSHNVLPFISISCTAIDAGVHYVQIVAWDIYYQSMQTDTNPFAVYPGGRVSKAYVSSLITVTMLPSMLLMLGKCHALTAWPLTFQVGKFWQQMPFAQRIRMAKVAYP